MDVQPLSFARTLAGTISEGGNRPYSHNSIPRYEVAVVNSLRNRRLSF